ncbi:universal stress protein [Aestuariivivens sediminis]|uniref:universal stress protein n=1 Tax=Aestuariivivens sediminis TaxID=2913557 RepID=UPI001F5A4922|nr:universal stress protein [Aestuariivivens sediminis]
MKNKKFKILVLADFSKSVKAVLNNTIGLAKIIDAEIDVLYVKKPTEIVDKDNQLTAMRTINQEHFNIKKDMMNTLHPLSVDHDINIQYNLSYGNIKNEIKQYIKSSKPDIIVLGKRKQKTINLPGNNITEYVIKHFSGTIMISANDNAFESHKKPVLGLFNNSEVTSRLMFGKELIDHSAKPLKSFRIIKNSAELKHSGNAAVEHVDEYVFEQNDNTIKNISNYMLKNNVNLLLLERSPKSTKNKTNPMITDLKKMIHNLEVSLLLSGEKHPNLNRI